ncbi:molybdate-anion transporter-like [Saccoglossus kowalevskii]
MVFIPTFYGLSFVCIILYVYTKTKVTYSEDAKFRGFQATYLLVFLLASGLWTIYQGCMCAGWVFIIYLVLPGFGRRANCIIYGILYGLSCVTKHFPYFHILMIGRILGGTATSILFSAFESWLVYEHNSRGFDSELLSTVFSHATLGNSLVAIGSGIVAQVFADNFGFVAPFDLSLTVLVIMCVFLVTTWTENYGDATGNVMSSMKSALISIKQDRKILCLGLIQSLFEGSMYTFVLEWTPALTPPDPPEVPAGLEVAADDEVSSTIPHGWIFANFMVAIMIGSSLFKILCKYSSPESFMRLVLFIGAISLVVPIVLPNNKEYIFAGFIVFEVCVGIFWPAMGTMRGQYVPEARLPMAIIFKCCVGFLLAACVAQQVLFFSVPSPVHAEQLEEQSPSSPKRSSPVTIKPSSVANEKN